MKKLNKTLLHVFTLLVGMTLSYNSLKAEGTKEMTPSSSANNVQLHINRSSLGGFASTFGGWTATSVNDRIFIHINNYATEKIYLGFKESVSGNVYWRLKRPDGTVVYTSAAIPNSGAGSCRTWNQANIGPSALTGNTGGYSAITINLATLANAQYNGDFYIEFNTSNTTANTDEIFLDYYDITVADGSANTSVKEGRLWSYNWGFNSGGYTPPNTCVGSLYVYSKDSVVTEVDLNGISPYFFRIFANSTGVGNTGNITEDRKSVDYGSGNPNERPEYKVFLNDPDNSAYPSNTNPDRTATFNSLTGCPGNYCLNFTVNGAALAELQMDLNNNGVFTDAVDRTLEAHVVAGSNCISWDGKDGAGNNVASSSTIKLQLSTKIGTLHIPVYDAEQNTNGYLARIVRPSGFGTMTVYWDDNNLSGGSTNLTGVASTAPQTGTTTATGHHSWMDPTGNQRVMNTWFTYRKSVISTFPVTVTPNGAPTVSPITGANYFCKDATENYNSATAGGVWSSNNTAVATVDATGKVTGVSTGAATLSYTVTSACGSTTVTKGITINTVPTVASVYGDTVVSMNHTITLSDSTNGGVWSTSDANIATVNSSGVVTGVAGGLVTITYTVTNTCGNTAKSIQIRVSYNPPTAVNDTATCNYGVPVNINASSNDLAGSFAISAGTLELIAATAPNASTVGTFTNNSNGTVTFTPVSTFSGTTTIQYRIYDTDGNSATAYIVVNVLGPCVVDADGDNVPDCLDEYPSDVNRAFNNHFPATGMATLMFEDEWPNRGDYDLNDIVVDYKQNTITNGQNQVVEVKYTMVLRCTGAGLHNGFAFQLDNISPSKITSVIGTKLHNESWLDNASNGTENGQSYANIIVFDNAYKVLLYPGSGNFINTYHSSPKVPYDTSYITVTFINNGVAPSGGTVSYAQFPATAFNPYIIKGEKGSFKQVRSHEIHLTNRVPSSKMNMSLFGTADDASTPSSGKYYRTANNLPWAIQVTGSIPYMQEKEDILTGYLHFQDWAESAGQSYSNWYLQEEGYRNPNKLYNK